jgi:hypothetical protein
MTQWKHQKTRETIMKRSINTLLLTLTVTLAIGEAESNAQSKFGGKSGGKSNSSSSSGRSSGRSFGGFSGGGKSSNQSSSTSKGTQRFGGFSSNSQSSKTGNTTGKGLQNHGSFNSGKTSTKGGLTIGGNSNTKFGHNFTNNSQGGLTLNNNHKVDTKDIKLTWTSKGTHNGKVTDTKVQVQPGQWGLGGQHKTQQTTKNSNWQGVAKHLIHHNFHNNHWCQHRPAVCQWWNKYCTPIAHSHQHEVVVCNWHHITCAPIVHIGVQVQPVQWYLGMKGILLPGQGIGIDAIEPGSPAEQVGLQPGMVLVNCNGIDMVDEAAMQQAVATSGGILKMTLLSGDGGQLLEGVVQMTQVSSVAL